MKPIRNDDSILGGLKPLTEEECERCWGRHSDGEESDRIAIAMVKENWKLWSKS